MTELIIFIVAFFTCILGGMIDARMWGDKKLDPLWLDKYTDYIWLGGWNVYQPYVWFTLGWFACLGQTFGLFHYYGVIFWAMLGNSVFWDMTFFKIESNLWVRPIRLWTKLGIPFFKVENRIINRCLSIENNSLAIGFNTYTDMMKFNIFRVVVLLATMLYYVI